MLVQNETGIAYYDNEKQHDTIAAIIDRTEVYMLSGLAPKDAEKHAVYDIYVNNLLSKQQFSTSSVLPKIGWIQ